MINKILSQYRYLKVKQNLIDNIIQFLILLICFLSISIFIEQVLFLSELMRWKIFLATISSVFIFISYLIIKSIINIKSLNKNLSDEILAKEIGNKIPKLSDKMINILQLSKASYKNKTKEQLSKIAIASNEKELKNIDIRSLIPKISHIRKIGFAIISISFICLAILSQGFAGGLERIYNHNVSYKPPKPFTINQKYCVGDTPCNCLYSDENKNKKQDKNELCNGEGYSVFQGEAQDITFFTEGDKHPDHLMLYYEQNDLTDSIKLDNNQNKFQHTFKNIRTDIKYWTLYKNTKLISSWNLIESKSNNIEVVKRPVFTDVNFEIKYPSYIDKSNQIFESNIVQFEVLEQSIANCEVKANQKLDSAYLIINKQDTLMLEQEQSNAWTGKFKIEKDLTIEIIGVINFDNQKIKNETPPIYKIKSKIDAPPNITVIKPEDNSFEMPSDNKIPLYFQLEDDLKLRKSWIEFSIVKPSYIENDSIFYTNVINEYDTNIQFLNESYIFDTNPLNLFPGDQLKFRILCQDNNPNPGVTKSSFYYAIIPSFDDIIESMIEQEDQVQELSNNVLEQVNDIEKNLEEMKLDMLKSTEASWEHQKQGAESIQKMEDLFDEIEKMQDALEKLEEEADKGNLVDQDLVEKFDQFQELLNSIMTPELLEALQKMQEAIDNMDLEKMLQATENFEYNLQQFEQQLDRFIEMFELALAEQKLDELVSNLENLVKNQENIQNELENNTPPNQLADDQERQNKEFEKLQSTIKEASKNLEKFSENTAQNLDQLLNSQLNKDTQKSLDDSQEKLSNKNKNAIESVSESSENLKSMLENAEEIKELFKDESVQKMSQEFYSAIKSILTLSSEQERLLQNFTSIRSSSPQLKPLTAKQFNISKQFSNFINQIFELSTKTFHISPNINQKIGFCKKSIDNSIINLEQRKVRTSTNEQNNIIGSMNDIALMLIDSMNEMQNTGSAAGLESYLEQLEQMGEGQSQINMGTMQLGQMGMMSQQEMMKRLQAQQQSLKEQLEQIIEEMPGSEGEGGLSKAVEEMEEVIQSFKDNRINNETKNKQQKILSRLLDSQKSLKKKEFSDKRKGSAANDIEYEGAIELPDNLGQKELIFINAMEEALEQNYSKEYEEIFKTYFKELHNETTK